MSETEQTAIAKPGGSSEYDIVKQVQKTLAEYANNKELILPKNYSVENALKSAWLVLQETVNKDKVPVLNVCSQTSIANALLDMAVQGLNPGKKQCYFIAYGKKLLCQRSYFGTMAVAREVAGATNILAEVVYEGDVFEYSLSNGQKTVKEHSQKLENIDLGNIRGAYCVLDFEGKPSHTEIMTMAQIRKSWEKSKANLGSPAATHTMFPSEMCKRTVISRACKKFINSSADNNLFLEHFHRADEEQTEGEVAGEIAENANKQTLELQAPSGTGNAPENATPEATAESTTNAEETKTEKKRDPKTVKTILGMFKACETDFGLTGGQVCKELGVSSPGDITITPTDCYLRIAAVWDSGPEKEEEPKS